MYRELLFAAMYEAFKDGKFDVICVYRLNRLWRKAALADFLMENFVRHGLKRLISCFENVDLDTASGRFYVKPIGGDGSIRGRATR